MRLVFLPVHKISIVSIAISWLRLKVSKNHKPTLCQVGFTICSMLPSFIIKGRCSLRPVGTNMNLFYVECLYLIS